MEYQPTADLGAPETLQSRQQDLSARAKGAYQEGIQHLGDLKRKRTEAEMQLLAAEKHGEQTRAMVLESLLKSENSRCSLQQVGAVTAATYRDVELVEETQAPEWIARIRTALDIGNDTVALCFATHLLGNTCAMAMSKFTNLKDNQIPSLHELLSLSELSLTSKDPQVQQQGQIFLGYIVFSFMNRYMSNGMEQDGEADLPHP
ncbi:hypothetical protein C1H76_8730 [Elsinoe australis]|uniref:Uncharacterized protein n=1 Tax=Elsinoe australis TaxID=40998 RepID=A0A4V6DT34_9PEZI|nr:hypothetical protein C1H76_8730 [Elsinoe australis]